MYHAGNQVQSSKGKNEQMHPTQNQGYFQGKLPDQELCDPAIGNYQRKKKKRGSYLPKLGILTLNKYQDKIKTMVHMLQTIYIAKRLLRDDTQNQNAQNIRLL